jgi:hypothetical protein
MLEPVSLIDPLMLGSVVRRQAPLEAKSNLAPLLTRGFFLVLRRSADTETNPVEARFRRGLAGRDCALLERGRSERASGRSASPPGRTRCAQLRQMASVALARRTVLKQAQGSRDLGETNLAAPHVQSAGCRRCS